MRELTKRYITFSLDAINVGPAIRYERYYINNNLRIQKKGINIKKKH